MKPRNTLNFLRNPNGRGPRIHSIALHTESQSVIDKRVRRYLQAMGLPTALAAQWQACAQHDAGDAIEAFAHVRKMMADHWQHQSGQAQLNAGDTPGATRAHTLIDESVQVRLCCWLDATLAPEPALEPALEPEQCAPRIETLLETPPILRRSMAPERGDI